MKRILKNYILTALLVLLVISPLLIWFLNLVQIENSYRASENEFTEQTSIDTCRKQLDSIGISTAMPGNGTAALSFSAPFGLSFEDTAYNSCSFSYGDTIECDFVSWSHHFFRERMVKIVVNGKEYSAKMTTSQLARLYKAALKQNGLEEQFKEDTGRKLTLSSAKDAIRQLDITLFEKGIHKAYNYPYDRRMVKLIMSLTILFSIPICMMMTTILSITLETAKYQLWLKKYNAEKIESWDKIAGNLPQFVSLRESGLDKPVPEYRKLSFRERIIDTYKPVKPKMR